MKRSLFALVFVMVGYSVPSFADVVLTQDNGSLWWGTSEEFQVTEVKSFRLWGDDGEAPLLTDSQYLINVNTVSKSSGQETTTLLYLRNSMMQGSGFGVSEFNQLLQNAIQGKSTLRLRRFEDSAVQIESFDLGK